MWQEGQVRCPPQGQELEQRLHAQPAHGLQVLPPQAAPLTAVDLFSGIGGFSLAAASNGLKILCQVERDPRCLEFLRRAWPDVPKHDDIKTFPAKQYTGATIVMGGPPCQAISVAGKRLGEKDNRFLWKETLSAIFRIRPAWCLLENPAGFRTMGLDGVLSELEDNHYAARTFSIPACAVGAPHRRERYWIVCKKLADTAPPGRGQVSAESENGRGAGEPIGISQLAHPPKRRQRGNAEESRSRSGLCQGETKQHRDGLASTSQWNDCEWIACADGKLRRAPSSAVLLAYGLPDDLPAQLAQTHRSALGALGNSIVHQVAERIIAAMIEAEEIE